MKKITIILAVCLCTTLIFSCKNSQKTAEAEPKTQDTVATAVQETTPQTDVLTADDELIMNYIKEMYEKDLYWEVEWLEKHCTPKLLKQLKDDYEYDGEGYAFWEFRSDSNDGGGEDDRVVEVVKKNGEFYYEGVDGGTWFRNIVSAFVKDGVVMFDAIRRDTTYVQPAN